MVTAMHPLSALSLLFALADTLSGRVTDRAGSPLPTATVLVSELHRVATTGADGAFVLADLPSGQYTVIVRHVGFAPGAREWVIRGAPPLGVALERAPLWLEPVTIPATRAPIPTLASPLATAALSEDALRREQSVSLAHSLSPLPGIHALSQIGRAHV